MTISLAHGVTAACGHGKLVNSRSDQLSRVSGPTIRQKYKDLKLDETTSQIICLFFTTESKVAALSGYSNVCEAVDSRFPNMRLVIRIRRR